MSRLGTISRITIAGLAVLAGGLFAAACQATSEADAAGPPLAPSARQPDIQPAPLAYGLHFLDLGDEARLAYGAPDSDAVKLMLQCAKGSGRIEVSDNAEAGSNHLVLSSGDNTDELSGRIEPGVTRPIVMATAPAAASAFRSFRENGRIAVGAGDGSYVIAANSAERPGLERFFQLCQAA